MYPYYNQDEDGELDEENSNEPINYFPEGDSTGGDDDD